MTIPTTRHACLAALSVACVATAATAYAVPGPDSTVVIARADDPESVALARRYADARDLPDAHVCLLPVDAVVDIPLDDYRTDVVAALEACLEPSGALEHIEAIVIARGMPLRVSIPHASGTDRASLAAALSAWRTTIDGRPMVGERPCTFYMGSCIAPAYRNAFQSGVFEAGWTRTAGSIEWHPMIATMLHGRSYEDAGRLIDSALDAEEMGGARGQLMLMDGADPARGVLDAEYPRVIADLEARGFTDVVRVPFNSDLTGQTLAAFFTGTASLGTTIEGNTFLPGTLVDNLTSFGAVPQNFEPTGETQVSIARWVALGVAGVHGTTDEPLNGAFPSRHLLVAYVDGSTLGEAYHRALPVAYWHNLVLGDPMLAPYAVRPVVTVEGVAAGESVTGARRVRVSATDPEGIGIAWVALLVDGVEVARVDGDSLDACVDLPDRADVQILAVAQKIDDLSDRGLYRPKGWTALRATGTTGPAECASEDAGSASDGGRASDGGPATDGGSIEPPDEGGCGCSTPTSRTPAWGLVASGVVLVLARARRRRRGARGVSLGAPRPPPGR